MAHATSTQPGLPRLRDISAETMKIPEPIMTPTTIMVESNKPNSRENSWSEVRSPAGSLLSRLFNDSNVDLNVLTCGYCIDNIGSLTKIFCPTHNFYRNSFSE